MSISSIAPSPPPAPPQRSEPKPPAANDNDSRTATPPVQAALPPGQGTRVNIIA